MRENGGVRAGGWVWTVLAIGAAWGIFEATAGYLLHLLPVSVGFLIWYPVAVFFLTAAHRATGRRTAVLAAAALAASVKLLNLMLPGRVDRVLNPAVSILLEGVAVFAAIYLLERAKWTQRPAGGLLVSIGMNTLWRGLYLGYLALLVPDWIREASVLGNGGALLRFMVIDNLCSSLIVFAGMLILPRLKGGGAVHTRIRSEASLPVRVLMPAALLAINIVLQMAL